MSSGPAGRVLVYGGKGALGSVCVSYFKAKNWWVGSIDVHSNDQADANILVKLDQSWTEQNTSVLAEVGNAVGNSKVDAILCLAGGWAGGNAGSDEFIKNADLMWKQSVWTSTIAAAIASKHLSASGLLCLTGAEASLGGTPGMIGYGLAKAAVHQLVKSLSASNGGLPENAHTSAILPITLDTPMNRKFMPKADHSKWTSLEFVANLLHDWANEKNRPENGSLIKLITNDNKTEVLKA